MANPKGKLFVYSATLVVTKRIVVRAFDHATARQKAKAVVSKLMRAEWVQATDDALDSREPEVEFEEVEN